MKNVAFLGLGIMGGPMAAHIQRAGHSVTVYNRSPGTPGEHLALAAGCTRAHSVREAVSDAEIVCCCLGDESSVRAVLLGADGAIPFMAKGSTVIDFTTIGRRAAVDIAADVALAGKTFIDAPMTGGDVAAKNASLTIMAGATHEELRDVISVLDAVSNTVVACGEVGAGQATKLINQLMVAVNLASVCEAMAAADALGIAADTVVDACASGAAGSWQLTNLGLRAAEGDYAPGFKMSHLIKDLRLLVENLESHRQPEFAFAVHQHLSALVAKDAQYAQKGTQALYDHYGG